MLHPDYIHSKVKEALDEDVGEGDITAALLPPDKIAEALLITREAAVICGTAFVDEVFSQLDPGVAISWKVKDGQVVAANEVLCQLQGPVRSLLTGERTALNFLQTLSGTATTTHHLALVLKNSKTQLLDTRKTLPGLRAAQKYAVRCGGGHNHRMGLFDAYLIKENHILACGGILPAVLAAKQRHFDKKVEVEVENLSELEQALKAGADIIMLDNFDLTSIQTAVTINAGRAKLEVSGNVGQQDLLKITQLGVDFISIGALTKHVQAIDLSMRLRS